MYMLKFLIIEPRHVTSNNVVCVISKGSDQPAHTRSLIRAFASRLYILWLFSYWRTTFGVSQLNRKPHWLVWVYSCQNTTLLESTCRDSILYILLDLTANARERYWYIKNSDVASGARGLNLGLSLPLLPYFCIQEAKALTRLVYAGSSKPSMPADAISTKISWSGPVVNARKAPDLNFPVVFFVINQTIWNRSLHL